MTMPEDSDRFSFGDSEGFTFEESERITEQRGWESVTGAAALALAGIFYTAVITVLGVLFAVMWSGVLWLYVVIAVAGLSAIVWFRNDVIGFVDKHVARLGRPKQIYPPH